MVRPALTVTKPDFSALRREGERIRRLHDRAALEVTDLTIQKAHRHVQAKMRSVGLGKLDKAVGWTSAKRKGQKNRTPYGVIFAKGGDESLSGGALEAYSRGTTITAKNGTWLAYPTAAAPRLINSGGRRRRLEPGRWAEAGLNAKIGKLIFKRVDANTAVLAVRKVSISPKTGQAKALGRRAPRTRIVPKQDTVVFVLIRQTRRAKRFDKDTIIGFYANRMPDYMARTLEGYQRGA
jgi:hypothetical protein